MTDGKARIRVLIHPRWDISVQWKERANRRKKGCSSGKMTCAKKGRTTSAVESSGTKLSYEHSFEVAGQSSWGHERMIGGERKEEEKTRPQRQEEDQYANGKAWVGVNFGRRMGKWTRFSTWNFREQKTQGRGEG